MAKATPEDRTVLSERDLDDSAPNVNALKQLRTNAKRQHTALANKIAGHISERGSKSELRVFRSMLTEFAAACLEHHNNYVEAKGATADDLTEHQWLSEVDQVTLNCFADINAHLNSRSTTSSVASSKEAFSSASSTTRAQLRVAEKQRRETELQVIIARQEREKRAEESRILRALEQQALEQREQIDAERTQRSLEALLERQRLQEELLREEVDEEQAIDEDFMTIKSTVGLTRTGDPTRATIVNSMPTSTTMSNASRRPTIAPPVPSSPVDHALNAAQDSPSVRSFEPAPIPNAIITVEASDVSPDSWIARLKPGSPAVSVNQAATPWATGLLPKIDIQPFDGNPTKWPLFSATFKSLVHDLVPSDAQRIAILRELLVPKIRDSIAQTLHSPVLYPKALEELKRRYGNPQLLTQAYIQNLLDLPVLKNDDFESLEDFSLKLHGAVSTLVHTGIGREVLSSTALYQVVQKFPLRLRNKWGRRVFSLMPRPPTLIDLDSWLEDMVMSEALVRPIEPLKETGQKKDWKKTEKPYNQGKDRNPSNRKGVFATAGAQPAPIKGKECPSCHQSHPLENCDRFRSLSPLERISLTRDKGCCFRCLERGHLSRDCQVGKECSIGECKRMHHPLLHGAPRAYDIKGSHTGAKPSLPVAAGDTANYHVNAMTTPKHDDIVLLSVVPVCLSANGITCETYALLDNGSEASLVRDDIATLLKLEGPKQVVRLGTFHGSDPQVATRRVNFMVSSRSGDFRLKVTDAYTVPRLNVSRRALEWPRLKRTWKHLEKLDLSSIDSGEVTVLLGMDAVDAHDILEVRKPPRDTNAPKAIHTPFGWCVVGRLPVGFGSSASSKAPPVCGHVNLPEVSHTDDTLHSMVKKFWEIESLGIKATPQLQRPDHALALNSIGSTIRHNGVRYEVGLPWKSNEISLPNNRDAALRRLFSLGRRFRSDPEYARNYEAIINEYVQLGHAEKLSYTELDGPRGRTWYLPHHGVTNPNRPAKVRVVFDASARHHGTSLNDCLLQGPDLLISLVGLLIRFRENPVAVSSDIEKMFHQVLVRPDDQPALRFLWRAPNSNEAPATYQMRVQIFGAISSPTVCNYALRQVARDFATESPELQTKIERQFYVDNYLDSVETENEALDTCKGLTTLLARGGFRLTKWLSSSRRILNSLPPTERLDPRMNVDLDDLPVERTLGILWNSETDAFSFKVNVRDEPRTKREVLSTVASLFDPLGFLAPVVLTAKALLQEVWRTHQDWDEALPGCLLEPWRSWLCELSYIENLSIPRCFKTAGLPRSVQLHVFCDASETGYGAVAYIRLEYDNGAVDVAFVMAKARVAPLRQLTIPRLELLGAVIGARLAQAITTELRLTLLETVFWTDSTTVLKWINSKTCRFTTFVANRVGEILEISRAEQWNHVPGRLNPADDASRGVPASQLTLQHRWFNGPDFLTGPRPHWPKWEGTPDCSMSDPEVLPSKWAGHVAKEDNCIITLMMNASRLCRPKRILTYMMRFTNNARAKSDERRGGPLSAHELRKSFALLLRIAQQETFREEIAALRKSDKLPNNSRLLKLTPYLDEGLLRVGGRLEHADLDRETKHPLILDPDSHLARLLIGEAHERVLHESTDRTFAEVRSKYWILRGRATIRRFIRHCPFCIRFKAMPQAPMMAPLPRQRLEAYKPPFTHTGVDFFGPMFVVIHRRTHKRYGCLFTCLTTRAIHLEVAHSLDTDSFLLAFRRFVSRRGCPTTCFSDNGTNLAAGEKELREGLRRWNQDNITDCMAQKGIEWHFSPPASPHFGGVWERMVRSAKRALNMTLKGQVVTDELLVTVFAEAESLINGRPLTHVSVDHTDPEPLTPNHFLMGRSNLNLPPDIFREDEISSRKRWRATQALTNRFWKRWLREYVPALIERRKWLAPKRNLKEGDLVLIVDHQSPRGHWPLGRIAKPLPGPDGQTRAAIVKTASGEYTRPTVKLCLLEETRE